MSKMMKHSLALVALLLATTAAIAQVPVLKKPVLAPQVKPAIPAVVLKTPITVVNAASIASSSPNRGEAARRLKAQNVPVAAALAALRNTFPDTGAQGRVLTMREGRNNAPDVIAAFANAESNLLALRTAGYATPDLMVALKQADSPSAASMLFTLDTLGIPAAEWTPSMRQLYTLDFDALLADLRRARRSKEWFGTALYVMGYNVEQMAQTGYRYFNGGFSNRADDDTPYPGPAGLYSALKYELPIAEHVQINDYVLWVMMMNAGYSPALLLGEMRMGVYNPRTGDPADPVAHCMTHIRSLDDDQRPESHVNPAMTIRIAPDGSANHSDAQRGCYVQFLDRIRREGATRTASLQLATSSVQCLPQGNPACPALLAEVAERMVTEARYPPEKN